MTATDRTGLRILDPDACWRHITSHRPRVGRVAFRHGGRLHLLPVAYALESRTIVFCSDPARLPALIPDGEPIAFQVDAVDRQWEQGWSVLVQGNVKILDGEDELERVRLLPLHPWVPGREARYLRIVPERITGRRII